MRIIKQPVSVSASAHFPADVRVIAVGDDLKYAWYFKNPGGTKFSYSSSFTSDCYSVRMDSTRNGRQIYCVVTDKYGNSVQSDTVTISMK